MVLRQLTKLDWTRTLKTFFIWISTLRNFDYADDHLAKKTKWNSEAPMDSTVLKAVNTEPEIK